MITVTRGVAALPVIRRHRLEHVALFGFGWVVRKARAVDDKGRLGAETPPRVPHERRDDEQGVGIRAAELTVGLRAAGGGAVAVVVKRETHPSARGHELLR